MKTPEILEFLLNLESVITREHRVWANNQPIVQSNGTHPRVRQLAIKEAVQFVGILTDKTSLYDVRILRSEDLAPLIRYDVLWELSFDEGATRMRCKCLQILEHPAGQNVGWIVTLER